MARKLRTVGTLAATAFAGVAVFYAVALRTKSPAMLGVVRRINRAVFNPAQLKSAGSPGASASLIHHRGRTSGRPYRTPVGAVPTDGGFVVALPYGTEADWLRNVMAQGEATIEHEGRQHRVVEPEVVPIADAASSFSDSERRVFRLFGVDQCLRVRTAGVAASLSD